MELLSPSPPPRPAAGVFHRAPSPADLRHLFDGESPPAAGKVHVAVGNSPSKTLSLLQWTFRHFGCKEVVLVHVHQPSPMIPTALGKFPASQANEEMLSAYRREERQAKKKIILSYLRTCYRAQVQANIILTESEHIHKGIVDLVASHGIQRLVIGATPDNCFKVKGSSSKATYTAKNAPPFCEIWFVSKGKHVWTREASESMDSYLPVLSPHETVFRERTRSGSLHGQNSEPMLNPQCFGSSALTSAELEGGNTEVVFSTTNSSITYGNHTSSENPSLISTASSVTSPVEINCKEELKLDAVYDRLKEVMIEVERSKKESFAELARRKELESEVAEAFNRVKDSEAAYASESKFREELEGLLKTAKQQQEELVYQRYEAMRELQNAMRTIAFLNGHAQGVTRRIDEAAGELELIQSSIATLRLERQKIQWQREESVHQFERRRSSCHARYAACNRFVGFGNGSCIFTDFSLSDLQTATCEFSESFKIGQGGYGCVYKGEILNRSVAIKKLHPHNGQGQLEFQQEVYVLSKLRHPHLVTLIGVCPEALSLVYEYLPNGNLHDYLFRRTTNPPLTWKARTRAVAEISSALLFLHSCKPEKIVHGDLKPEKIFLDSNFSCKIVDFGLSRLVPEETAHDSLFCQNMEPKGTYPYADPEYRRTRVLTTKCDVYSFGMIILQLLTGQRSVALAIEVRRAVSAGRLSSIVDPTAGEWPTDVASKLAEFGLRCCEINGRNRPELTPEIVRELKQLHVPEERPIPPYFLCPILHEIMHDPHSAADGFTYEKNALRGWLQSGQDTSPMTNLRLEHLNLTPNHALRFAIQDWLCGSSASFA